MVCLIVRLIARSHDGSVDCWLNPLYDWLLSQSFTIAGSLHRSIDWQVAQSQSATKASSWLAWQQHHTLFRNQASDGATLMSAVKHSSLVPIEFYKKYELENHCIYTERRYKKSYSYTSVYFITSSVLRLFLQAQLDKKDSNICPLDTPGWIILAL